MAMCPGSKGGRKCNSTLYKCKTCGNVGCSQSTEGKCTNQAFKMSKCLKCGKSGGKQTFR